MHAYLASVVKLILRKPEQCRITTNYGSLNYRIHTVIMRKYENLYRSGHTSPNAAKVNSN